MLNLYRVRNTRQYADGIQLKTCGGCGKEGQGSLHGWS